MDQKLTHPSQRNSQIAHRQRGVAAIEFALIALLMIVILLGLFIWWRYFQTSQILHRAGGDAARLVHSLVITGTAPPCAVPKAAENQLFIENQITNIMELQVEQANLSRNLLEVGNFLWSCSANGAESFSFDVNYSLPALLGSSTLLSEPGSLAIEDKIKIHFPSQM